MVFQCINIRQVPWEVLKTAVSGTWRMLMHEKPCLIPILLLSDNISEPMLQRHYLFE